MKNLINLLSRWRESFLFPLAFMFVLWGVLGLIEFLTQRPAMFDVGVLADQVMNLFGVLVVTMLVGAMKGKNGMLPDIGDDDSWQKLAIDTTATCVLIISLSWLVLR